MVPALMLAAALSRSAGAAVAANDRYDAVILRYAERRRLNPRLVKAVIATESEFHPGAVSPSGARGLMQVMPETARELGTPPESLTEPDAGVRAGTDYLAGLLETLWRRERLPGACCRRAPARTLRRALAAYHAGPRAFDAPWPAVTRLYVAKVMRHYRSTGSVLRLARAPAPPRPRAQREESEAQRPRRRPTIVPGNRGEVV